MLLCYPRSAKACRGNRSKARHDLCCPSTSCPKEVSVARIQRRTKEKYESNALTVEAYLANKSKFEPVDLDDLKQRYRQLKIIHFTVDTCHDSPENWFVIGMGKR